jgi:hypothetical protein
LPKAHEHDNLWNKKQEVLHEQQAVAATFFFDETSGKTFAFIGTNFPVYEKRKR